MDRVEYLVRFENENTNLDFKSMQYDKPKFEALLKDVLSMANAVGDEDRFIIVGVKFSASGEREILGVKPSSFVDSAVYQQLIYENIEPHIEFEYYPYEIDGQAVGVFRFSNCTNRPYMMKKDYRSLRKGDAFIRRGDSQDRLIRRDLDTLFELRSNSPDFGRLLAIGFDVVEMPTRIALPVSPYIDFPSQEAAARIQSILETKRELARQSAAKKSDDSETTISPFGTMDEQLRTLHTLGDSVDFRRALYPFGGIPYEHRTIEELEEALEKVGEWYFAEDMYEMYEANAHRLNLRIVNKATEYLENASLELTFPSIDGLLIADRVYHKPKKSSGLLPEPDLSHVFPTSYPEVHESSDAILVTTHLGDVKHHIPEVVFGEPLRILLAPNLAGSELKIRAQIFGKNLRKPIERELTIEVMESETAK